MTYTKPSIDRVQVVGQMASTPSECDLYGGRWIAEKQYCELQPIN